MARLASLGALLLRSRNVPAMIDTLARALERGEVDAIPGELEMIADMLDEEGLRSEADRVRRWLELKKTPTVRVWGE